MPVALISPAGPHAVAEWAKIAKIKRAQRETAIPPSWRLPPGHVPEARVDVTGVPAECGLLSKRELEISETGAELLVQRILDGAYSSYEVTLAFCKRAAIAQQLTNCLSEIFFETALENAKLLDEQFAASGVAKGPLHGLPVSLKDCFVVEGTAAAVGYTALALRIAAAGDESAMTKIMRDCGAILFCKTTVPLALMSGETYSNIYGYTTNPFNRSLSSGGSSGGEGALLAMKGSPLGIGTDIGGSIRIPASFCGLYSLKPSYGRFPTHRCVEGLPGQESIKSVNGPMSSTLAGVELWSKAVIDAQPWQSVDPHCLPIPWRSVAIPDKLCFGLIVDDGVVKPLPPVSRALVQMRVALEALGHTVIEFPMQLQFADALKFDLYRAAGARTLHSTLAETDEPWPRGYELFKSIMAAIHGGNDPLGRVVTVNELWTAQASKTQYEHHFLRAWTETRLLSGTGREVDALILPCSPWPACAKHHFSYDNYTSIWNILDYCATTIPVTTVMQALDDRGGYQCRNDVEASIWDGCAARLPGVYPSGRSTSARGTSAGYDEDHHAKPASFHKWLAAKGDCRLTVPCYEHVWLCNCG